MEKYLIVIMSVLVILFNSYYNTISSDNETEGSGLDSKYKMVYQTTVHLIYGSGIQPSH